MSSHAAISRRTFSAWNTTDATFCWQKSPILAVILGFFVLGIFYSTGFNKQGVIAVVGLIVVSWLLSMFVSPEVSVIVNLVGAFLGYKWANDHNASIEGGGAM